VTPIPVMTVTDHGADVVVSVRGDFDLAAASRLQRLVVEFVAQGGAIGDLVIDLRSTTRCRTGALRCLTDLIAAGLRLHAGHELGRRISHGSRASCGA
jgi:anti-anti-sigma regulatory factor